MFKYILRRIRIGYGLKKYTELNVKVSRHPPLLQFSHSFLSDRFACNIVLPFFFSLRRNINRVAKRNNNNSKASNA